MTTAYVARHDRHRPIVSRLLEHTVPKPGANARSEVLRLAADYEELAREWIAAEDGLAEAQRSFVRSVVDGLQETAHARACI